MPVKSSDLGLFITYLIVEKVDIFSYYILDSLINQGVIHFQYFIYILVGSIDWLSVQLNIRNSELNNKRRQRDNDFIYAGKISPD